MTMRNKVQKKDNSTIADFTEKNSSVILLIDSWLNGDEDESEQKETFEHLKKVLDDDRLSDRKLFQ